MRLKICPSLNERRPAIPTPLRFGGRVKSPGYELRRINPASPIHGALFIARTFHVRAGLAKKGRFPKRLKLVLLLTLLAACSPQTPLTTVENYMRAVYARDYASAYTYLSAADQAALSKNDYITQYDAYTGPQLEIAKQLASWIELQQPQVTETGDSATVTAHVRAPDGNDSAVADILNQAAKPDADVAALKKKLDDLHRSGGVPFLEADQTFELRRASGRWGVSLDLGQAALVNFTAGVKAGLPWEFTPLQPSARLLVGDLVRVQFRVKNLSDQTVTGKAEEGTSPAELADYLHFYQCFCMLQLTLAPGQEQTLTAAIQLQQPVPAGTALSVHYDFYPLEAFPTPNPNL